MRRYNRRYRAARWCKHSASMEPVVRQYIANGSVRRPLALRVVQLRPVASPAELLVGSGTGAVIIAPVPAPATSHVACGFPALRVPAHFTTRVMRSIGSGRLPRMVFGKPLDTH